MRRLAAAILSAAVIASLSASSSAQSDNCLMDPYRRTVCAPARGTITTDSIGAVVCGKGQCLLDGIGQIVCATAPGGAVRIDNMGYPFCDGGCEPARIELCVVQKPPTPPQQR